MFVGKKWETRYPVRTSMTIYLIPSVKFKLYNDDKKYGSSIYETLTMCINGFPDVHK